MKLDGGYITVGLAFLAEIYPESAVRMVFVFWTIIGA